MAYTRGNLAVKEKASQERVTQQRYKETTKVVTRRTVFELRKARERGHIVEGLAVALANIDEVIQLIKTSTTGAEAKERLLDKLCS